MEADKTRDHRICRTRCVAKVNDKMLDGWVAGTISPFGLFIHCSKSISIILDDYRFCNSYVWLLHGARRLLLPHHFPHCHCCVQIAKHILCIMFVACSHAWFFFRAVSKFELSFVKRRKFSHRLKWLVLLATFYWVYNVIRTEVCNVPE